MGCCWGVCCCCGLGKEDGLAIDMAESDAGGNPVDGCLFATEIIHERAATPPSAILIHTTRRGQQSMGI